MTTIKLLVEQEEDALKMAKAYDLPNFSKAGTGKTLTALRAVDLAGLKGGLIACPKIALRMWRDNVEALLGADVEILTKGSQSPKAGTSFVITTYDLLTPLKEKLLHKFDGKGWAMINDECDGLRGHETKRAKTVFGPKLDLHGSLAEKFEQVWNLTGTPLVRYANDYFTQVAVLHPNVFAPYKADNYQGFENYFTFKTQKQYNPRMPPKWVVSGNRNEGLLRTLIYSHIGAIRRMEAPGLPDIVFNTLTADVHFTKEQLKLLKNMKPEQIIAAMNDEDSPISAMWRAVGLGKVADVVPYVGDISKTEPVLLGIWHRDVGDQYETALKTLGRKVVQVNGSTSDKAREQIQKEFNDGKIDVLIGQMRAMGVSWNIQQACNRVIIAEQHASSATYEQFYKRVYRYGQKNRVTVEDVYAENPIDEALRMVRLRKQASDLKINQ